MICDFRLKGGWHMQGFPWGKSFGKSLILDLCTQIVIYWWDFSLKGQHWDYDLALSLGSSQKALMAYEKMRFQDGHSNTSITDWWPKIEAS